MNPELINILLVEDNIADAELFQDILDISPESQAWNVTHVMRLAEALVQLDRDPIQVILLDLSLPDSQGLQTLVTLREKAPTLPIVVLTGLNDQQMGITAVREGAQDYLVKGLVSGGMITRSMLYAIERKKNEIAMQSCLEQERELREIKSRFISMLSHELRNPLTTILASADLMEKWAEELSEQKKREMNRKIKESATRMNKILDDLMVLWHHESLAPTPLNPSWFDLPEFCQKLVAEFQIQLDNQGSQRANSLELIWVSQIQSYPVYLDLNLLEQILSNLLSNAIKYSPRGGPVKFELTVDSNQVIFRIQDSGIGIPPSERDRLFTSFYRASNTQGISGTGLGLSIVKKAVDLQGGTIHVTSDVAMGSTFTVTLPLRVSPVLMDPSNCSNPV
ncbi:ATP-binding response regulator [Oscillatoria acuminata]|uniref:histidine kinase n=1 Tax=Oscillatoria acuminata PCC 6304 TaxID=56110 RepID=K9TQ19_9CYAN|nr:hybrid sensor histidine kinase/response regulator [Oscillatoria acuminata]AFY84937.1 signal transduction histidine kinase [Oscillatoria acuminata PCC 6304]